MQEKITRAYLRKKVEHYKKLGETEIAKAFILKYGPQIKDYNIGEELQKLEKPSKKIKENNKLKEEKEKESE